jgi:hypothetical protein
MCLRSTEPFEQSNVKLVLTLSLTHKTNKLLVIIVDGFARQNAFVR